MCDTYKLITASKAFRSRSAMVLMMYFLSLLKIIWAPLLPALSSASAKSMLLLFRISSASGTSKAFRILDNWASQCKM